MNPVVGTARTSDSRLRALVAELIASAEGGSAHGDALHGSYWEAALLDPAHDILRRPGKEFRRRTTECCFALGGGEERELHHELPWLVELLHAGSLVIDDIEDDSDTRRGEPTLHKRYGIPLALNTANWLYFLPLALLARMQLADTLKLALYGDISNAVVLCHQGQALDLSTQVASIRQTDMARLVAHSTELKTGSLMRLAALVGARAAGAGAERLAKLARFGTELGVGLQMLDDWSGIHNHARVHKGVEDVRNSRPTWPWAWLAQTCDAVTYKAFTRDAASAASDADAQELILRMREALWHMAPRVIHERLHAALAQLEASLGHHEALDDLRLQVAELEVAYG